MDPFKTQFLAPFFLYKVEHFSGMFAVLVFAGKYHLKIKISNKLTDFLLIIF